MKDDVEAIDGGAELARFCADAPLSHTEARGAYGGVHIDPLRRRMFFTELQRTPIIGVAARAAGLTVAKVRACREADPRFAAAWDHALTQSVDAVESKLLEKALAGDLRAIESVLKAKRPEEYRERLEVGVATRGIIEVDLVPAQVPENTEG